MANWLGEVKCPQCGCWQLPMNYCPKCGNKMHADESLQDIHRSLGDVTHIYNICGSQMGRCPGCVGAGLDGCGKHYVYGTIRSEPSPARECPVVQLMADEAVGQ